MQLHPNKQPSYQTNVSMGNFKFNAQQFIEAIYAKRFMRSDLCDSEILCSAIYMWCELQFMQFECMQCMQILCYLMWVHARYAILASLAILCNSQFSCGTISMRCKLRFVLFFQLGFIQSLCGTIMVHASYAVLAILYHFSYFIAKILYDDFNYFGVLD